MFCTIIIFATSLNNVQMSALPTQVGSGYSHSWGWSFAIRVIRKWFGCSFSTKSNEHITGVFLSIESRVLGKLFRRAHKMHCPLLNIGFVHTTSRHESGKMRSCRDCVDFQLWPSCYFCYLQLTITTAATRHAWISRFN